MTVNNFEEFSSVMDAHMALTGLRKTGELSYKFDEGPCSRGFWMKTDRQLGFFQSFPIVVAYLDDLTEDEAKQLMTPFNEYRYGHPVMRCLLRPVCAFFGVAQGAAVPGLYSSVYPESVEAWVSRATFYVDALFNRLKPLDQKELLVLINRVPGWFETPLALEQIVLASQARK